MKYVYEGNGKFNYHNNQYHTGEVVEIDDVDIDKIDMRKFSESKGVKEEKPSNVDEQRVRLKSRIERRRKELSALEKKLEGLEKPKKKKKEDKK